MRAYYVPSTLQGSGDISGNKASQSLCSGGVEVLGAQVHCGPHRGWEVCGRGEHWEGCLLKISVSRWSGGLGGGLAFQAERIACGMALGQGHVGSRTDGRQGSQRGWGGASRWEALPGQVDHGSQE